MSKFLGDMDEAEALIRINSQQPEEKQYKPGTLKSRLKASKERAPSTSRAIAKEYKRIRKLWQEMKESFFETCDRDKEGRCIAGSGGSSGGDSGDESGDKDSGKEERGPGTSGKLAPAPKGEKIVPPPCCLHDPDPHKINPKVGIATSPRVGVDGMSVPPPPKEIPRLPNLTEKERKAESHFARMYLRNPDGVAKEYRARMNRLVGGVVKSPADPQAVIQTAQEAGVKAKIDKDGNVVLSGGHDDLKGLKSAGMKFSPNYMVGDGPNIFNTDDAKLLSPDYNPQGSSEDGIKEARSTLNVAVHQTANVIAKRAFLQHLDEVVSKYPDGDPRKSVLVTSGGVASGKGFALKNADATKELQSKVGAVWDAAGEQNAAENPWVLEECKKRGIKPIFAFVHSDPKETWENPDRGVVERAGKVGRMVDARVFADSYAIGAKNFKAFRDKHKNSGDAEFFVLDNTRPPKEVNGKKVPDIVVEDEMPESALSHDSEAIYNRATEVIEHRFMEDKVKPSVLRGGTIGQRIWGKPTTAKSLAKQVTKEHEEPVDEEKPTKSKRSPFAQELADLMTRNISDYQADPAKYDLEEFADSLKVKPLEALEDDGEEEVEDGEEEDKRYQPNPSVSRPANRLKGFTDRRKNRGIIAKGEISDRVLAAVREMGGSMVKLSDLGKRLGVTPMVLHTVVNTLRRQGKLTGTASEGRHGNDPEAMRWGIAERGESAPIVFVALKQLRKSKEYDDSKPYGGRYGDWKKGDRFNLLGVEWEVVKIRDKGKTLLCQRFEEDPFGKKIQFLREFPLSSMGPARRL